MSEEGRLDVVATSGRFDLLTPSHVDFLRRARAMGDMLVVLLHSDDSGDHPKTHHTLWQRLAVLRELRCVDLVVPFNEATPEMALTALRPAYYVIGADHEEDTLDDLVGTWGGQTIFLAEGKTPA